MISPECSFPRIRFAIRSNLTVSCAVQRRCLPSGCESRRAPVFRRQRDTDHQAETRRPCLLETVSRALHGKAQAGWVIGGLSVGNRWRFDQLLTMAMRFFNWSRTPTGTRQRSTVSCMRWVFQARTRLVNSVCEPEIAIISSCWRPRSGATFPKYTARCS